MLARGRPWERRALGQFPPGHDRAACCRDQALEPSSAIMPTPSDPAAGARQPTRADAAPSGDVALLIDWENLKWGLREHFRAAPNITSVIAAARARTVGDGAGVRR